MENTPASLLCRWERHLAGFSFIDVVERWPATSKGARYSASRYRRMNVRLNTDVLTAA